MKRYNPKRIVTILAAAGLLAAAPVSLAGVVAPELETELQARAPHEEVAVIITLRDKVDPRSFKKRDKHVRRAEMTRALKTKADRSQRPLKALLEGRGARGLKQLWLINGMAVKVRADVARELADLPGVESIRPDYVLQAPAVTLGAGGPAEWNLNTIGVPDLWALGYSGAGVVVASMDSGVDPDHPDLVGKWRGGANSWFDPHGEHATPYDALGHGTQTMGILVGGSASGAAIGVAPDAQWIAVKIFDDAGQAQMSDIHQGFQWLLDPDGDPATMDAPDVVNASWGLPGTVGQCVPEFDADIQALKAAGIGVAFAAGNEGPAPLTSVSPANSPGVSSTGAIDSALVLADFSSRGPSPCDGDIFPKLSAPGVGINTADLSFGGLPIYATVSGTSYATPHAAGAMALLVNAFPTIDVASLETALTQSAQDLGVAGADNGYGYGLVDVVAAYNALNGGGGGSPPAVTSTPVTTATEGQPYTYQVTATDSDGDAVSFALDVAPAGMAVDPASGLITWTPGVTQVGVNQVTVHVQDGSGLSATQSYAITVANVNEAPVASGNSYSISAGGTLTVAAPGVLANDSDADGDPLTAVLVNATTGGTLTLNANGSFSYTPNTGTTADSFTYQASDGALASAAATVSITVVSNQAPVAANDSAGTRRNIAATIYVTVNDKDSDGSINPATVSIVTAPNKGGTAVPQSNGTVRYTPKRNFRGTEVFYYTVKDNLGKVSNTARVTVSVR
jgi:VCBS repeat-containing protein